MPGKDKDYNKGDRKNNRENPKFFKNNMEYFSKKSQQQNARNTFRGDVWDQEMLKHLLQSNHEILFQDKSEYQDIVMLRAIDVRMYLNEQLQFSTLDERFYHEALVHPAMTMAKDRSRILILGGGDGFALREVLKYDDVKEVDLVELDPIMLNLARKEPLRNYNEGALLDPRVSLHVMDAQNYFTSTIPSYNVIIVDFPDPADAVISKLYTKEFFRKMAMYLMNDGILVCQAHSPEDAPRVFWSIGLTMQSAGFYSLGYKVYVPSFGDWGFHIASKQGKVKLSTVSVPHYTLPKDLSKLFTLPEELREEKGNSAVNSLDNLILHEIYNEEMPEK
ncbi:spermidine synthase [Bacillus taeanensis]|nr:spermidine synthase [Bacillus taeanensis]